MPWRAMASPRTVWCRARQPGCPTASTATPRCSATKVRRCGANWPPAPTAILRTSRRPSSSCWATTRGGSTARCSAPRDTRSPTWTRSRWSKVMKQRRSVGRRDDRRPAARGARADAHAEAGAVAGAAAVSDELPVSDVLNVERRGHVLVATLNRPDRMNALSPQLHQDMPRHVEGRAVRCERAGDRHHRRGDASVLHRHGPPGPRRAWRTASGEGRRARGAPHDAAGLRRVAPDDRRRQRRVHGRPVCTSSPTPTSCSRRRRRASSTPT